MTKRASETPVTTRLAARWGLVMLALGCGEPKDVSPATAPPQPTTAASAEALCGGDERACCSAPRSPCARGLRCDEAAGVCRAGEGRALGVTTLCHGDAECTSGRRCCGAGTYGTCEAVDPAAECALPDLAVLSSGEGLTLTEEAFDGVTPSVGGCVRERGMRRLLRVDAAIANLGAADFILGGSEALLMDQASASDDFLRYSIIDASGEPLVTSHGPLPCNEDDDPSRTFSCTFAGLEAGSLMPAFGLECEALDVTELSAGAYRLRIELALAWPDADPGNDRVELPMKLPSFAPLEPCPPVENRLQGQGSLRECGWSRAPLPGDGTCSPGEFLWLDCGGCSTVPMLRLCAGDEICSAASARVHGYFPAEPGPLPEPCSSLQGVCPETGRYNVMIAAENPALMGSPCTLTLNPGL